MRTLRPAAPNMKTGGLVGRSAAADQVFLSKLAYNIAVSDGKGSKVQRTGLEQSLKRIESNTGIDLGGVPLRAGASTPWSNAARYFIPHSLRQVPSRAARGIGLLLSPLSPSLGVRILANAFDTANVGVGDFYSPASGTVHTTGNNFSTLAHEVGHYVDLEQNKSRYGTGFFGGSKSPFHNYTLQKELNATLFAHQAAGGKGLQGAQAGNLNNALGTYLSALSPKLTRRSFSEWWDNVDKFKHDKNWKNSLSTALKSGDRQSVRVALRQAIQTLGKVKAEPEVKWLLAPEVLDDANGNLKWTDPKTRYYPMLAKFLIDHENKRLSKVASLTGVSLQPHQQRLVDRIKQPGTSGILAQHGLGSGKTLSSIAAWDALGRPNTTVVVPAALQANYRKELNKWVGEEPTNVDIISQQLLSRQKGLTGPTPDFLIVDEQHKAREQSSALRAALSTIKAKKRLLLTGTPIYNHPQDISSSVNLAAGKTVLPTDRAAFSDRYVTSEKVSPGLLPGLMGVKPGFRQVLKNQGELKRILKQYIDYHPNSAKGFPRSTEETVNVPMGAGQTDIYKAIMGKAPAWVRWKVKAGLPPGKGELAAMRSFLTGARQVSNTNREFTTRSREEAAKVDKAFQFFQKKVQDDPSYKGVVYSNFINSGLAPYRDRLQKANIPYGEFHGQVARKDRDEMVRQYNAGKLRALLLSSAGAEGLDLRGTSLVQQLDPSWNIAKEKQITGRAIRYGSHAGLPPEKQHVLVQHYLAQPRGSFLDRLFGQKAVKGADEYIYNLARQKDFLNSQVQELLK